VHWGLRVPPELPWPHGRRLMHQRLMGLPAGTFRPAPEPPGVTLRRARPLDLDDVVRVDAEAFGTDPAGATWFESLLDAARAEVVLAESEGEPVGTAYTLLSDGAAGPALYLGGVAVLAHLHPDTHDAARLYARLGFAEVPGLDVYVDL
jgi:ribosomal protein S18 acetylase RimI-like enzyme